MILISFRYNVYLGKYFSLIRSKILILIKQMSKKKIDAFPKTFFPEGKSSNKGKYKQ